MPISDHENLTGYVGRIAAGRTRQPSHCAIGADGGRSHGSVHKGTFIFPASGDCGRAVPDPSENPLGITTPKRDGQMRAWPACTGSQPAAANRHLSIAASAPRRFSGMVNAMTVFADHSEGDHRLLRAVHRDVREQGAPRPRGGRWGQHPERRAVAIVAIAACEKN